ncbi:MAG: FHA domain-containing protein [Pseudanabaenaceae cyanobacterium bins.68]|nr:FHA domain-containing protein [Pseudanabaenaceae cyanobacterium bins.68]
MITLHLLHPIDSNPVQTWQFEQSVQVSIGRSSINDVVLLSSVVSRHHVELQRQTMGWAVISKGANGTYLNGEAVDKIQVIDGMVIRLATTGPKMQIRLDALELEPLSQAEIDAKILVKNLERQEAQRRERMTILTNNPN